MRLRSGGGAPAEPPGCSTAREAAMLARLRAVLRGRRWIRPQVRAAVRQSPAPVASTARAGAAGRAISCSPSQATTPRLPHVTTATGTRSASARAAWRAEPVRV